VRWLLILLLLPSIAHAELRVAVLEFVDASTQEGFAPLGKGLQSMLTTDLAQVSAITVVERQRIAELQAELNLQRSGWIDASTASEVGRLLVATHLIDGSFTVVGESMRLDARLLSVESSEVVHGSAVDGEREAFFELEKDLVKDLIAGLQVKPAAKERAALGRIHTADFEAFSQFSQGIALFDQQAYDEAIARLKQATAVDAEFDLARVTLGEYERLIASLRTRSEEICTSKEDLRRLETAKKAQGGAQVLARLLRESQDGDERSRAAALYLLAIGYNNLGRNRGKLMEYRRAEDAFALARTGEAMAAAYADVALQRWPELPLSFGDSFHRGFPELDTFDADFKDATAMLFEAGADHPENRKNYLLNTLRYPREIGKLLRLSLAEEVALRETWWQRGLELQPGDYWLREQEEARWTDLRRVLRLDESTQLLEARSRITDNEWALKGLASEIELNRDLTRLLQEARDKALMREWLQLAPEESWSLSPTMKFAREQFLGARPTPEGLYQLNRMRRFDADDVLLVSGVPVFTLQSPWFLTSDHRPDPRTATAVRYHRAPGREGDDSILVIGGAPVGDYVLSLVVDETPASDFWPDRTRVEDHPDSSPPVLGDSAALDLLFGLRDVDVDKTKDEAGESVLSRPTTGYAVRLGAKTVQLLRIRETQRGSYGRKEAFAEEVLAEAPRRGAGVRLEVAGRAVTVAGARFKLPEAVAGFVGVRFRGEGYLELREVTLTAK